MARLPDGTITVMHTDIENSTPLTLHLREQYPTVLAAHRTLLRAAFAAHGGREVDTQGDSFFVVFRRATEAMAAAVRIQRALATTVWPEGGAVRVRIGLHCGEPVRTPEGYTGVDVVRGARVRDAGHGGQVLLSAATAALVQDALVDDLRLRDLGAYRLKGLPRPERIFQLLIPGLPADFPPLHTLDSRAAHGRSTTNAGVLTTVFFTDVVGSTLRLVELGDRRWHALRLQYAELVRRVLARHEAQEIDSTGDGFFALFDSTAAAIHCSFAVIASARGLGLSTRVGIHAGEVVADAAGITGLAVNAGARICGLAGPDEVLVSGVVKELVAGAGIPFVDRGSHVLRGLPGEWRLYSPAYREPTDKAANTG